MKHIGGIYEAKFEDGEKYVGKSIQIPIEE